ncbi:PepSY domain-containing protein [Streptomyces bambusae]|uniref:PepSY-associated TM helix domain-containing protein n=1 Tax=Streptomyces bambusae TaxID=1550616 RepID=UPI001CFFE003|nr:PepSY domain-containing protein [Streptomyces bambusae]MCB5169296.1 PepSY domain-containing protein [Streptomyces bambusae]
MAIDEVRDVPVQDPAPASDPAPDDAPDPASKAGTGTWAAVRPLLLRMHFYAGLLIAPLLFLAAATGLLYALSFQAEEIVYKDELTVSAPAGGAARPLSEQVAAATAATPQGEVVAVWPAPDAESTTRVLMEAPGVAEGMTHTVFVNPYTAEVAGQLDTSGDALPLRAWISGLHANLQLGETGRIYSELAASWMWVVALGGLALWIGRRRSRRSALVLPDRKATGRRRTLSWHATVGLWATAGLVVLSATGLTWSTYAGENIGQLQDRLGGATPAVSAALDGGAGGGDEHAGHHGGGSGTAPAPAGKDVGIDRVVEAAKAVGVTESLQITLPAEGKGYVVKERDRQVPVHLDSVAVNPADGAVMDTLRFADHPVLAKLTRYGIDAHMGLMFGLVNQLLLAALALAVMLLVFWGYRMWWLRRPTKARGLSFGRPQPRGAWRRLPVTALLPLAAATAVVGWFVPLLGISLAVFLVLDAVLGLIARRKAAAAA